MKVDNAIIMAAGTSSRFAPLSYEKPKSLVEVKGEVLVERQISQLQEAGISEIYIVTGYKAADFDYLKEKFNVKLIYNPEYLIRNNNGSLWVARDVIKNSYICSSDNYFAENPFEKEVDYSYYAAEYAEGHTAEWCMQEDARGNINAITIGGEHAWYMLGHAFWSESFSKEFFKILQEEYELPETKDKLWEKIFMAHLDVLKMKIRKYPPDVIFEFDTIDELRKFDTSYIKDTRSTILKRISAKLNIVESNIVNLTTIKCTDNQAVGFSFDCSKGHFIFHYKNEELYKSK